MTLLYVVYPDVSNLIKQFIIWRRLTERRVWRHESDKFNRDVDVREAEYSLDAMNQASETIFHNLW